jgi:hypothetical protein
MANTDPLIDDILDRYDDLSPDGWFIARDVWPFLADALAPGPVPANLVDAVAYAMSLSDC